MRRYLIGASNQSLVNDIPYMP